MAELGYHEPIPGIYGTANPATDSDPIARARLQEATLQAQIACASAPGAVPWSYERLGGGNVARIGWTAQNGAQTTVFPPYNPDVGTTPDWTGDPNAIGAGAYDMNQVMTGQPVDRLNRGPIGDAVFDGMMGVPPNPNAPDTDVSGTIDLEW
jgi:hypothetical protein